MMVLHLKLKISCVLQSMCTTGTRACLKIHSRHLHAPLCGIFAPNSGYVARYAPFIRDKSPTKCDAQLPESNFKTRSRVWLKNHSRHLHAHFALYLPRIQVA
ncbi:DUF6783 domain-containing protein [uncultured Robinsoniella sp.]|uniref:DUF6783 domain-containing protein n=1 Tax=uncultured Robinsoniella sp. TaxID=904190 RepID=UPI00374F9189